MAWEGGGGDGVSPRQSQAAAGSRPLPRPASPAKAAAAAGMWGSRSPPSVRRTAPPLPPPSSQGLVTDGLGWDPLVVGAAPSRRGDGAGLQLERPGGVLFIMQARVFSTMQAVYC